MSVIENDNRALAEVAHQHMMMPRAPGPPCRLCRQLPPEHGLGTVESGARQVGLG